MKHKNIIYLSYIRFQLYQDLYPCVILQNLNKNIWLMCLLEIFFCFRFKLSLIYAASNLCLCWLPIWSLGYGVA